MIRTPLPQTGAFIRLTQFLEGKKSSGYGVFVFGLLEQPEQYQGEPCHGIYWLAGVYPTPEEADQLASEIMDETGITHVRIVPIGSSGLLTTALDPKETVTQVDTQEKMVRSVERSNLKRSYQEKMEMTELKQALEEETLQLEDPDSVIYYAHVWLRYLQNRSVREQTERTLREYQKIERERREELVELYEKHPQHEEKWLNQFAEFRKRVGEEAALEQMESLWKQHRAEVLPQVYT